MARVGLLLSGCGFYDGTEISEAILALLSLDRLGVKVEFLAPGTAMCEAVDHSTGMLAEGDRRSVLAESARIARGRIAPVSEARVPLLSALIVPGGEGIARSLMRGVGEPGRAREVDPEVAALIRQMLDQRKPIGAISLAGALVPTVLGLPLEEDPFSLPASEIRIDEVHGVVFTPGHLSSDRLTEIALGVDRMVAEVMRRASRGLAIVS
jgi:enhancing lycopene biosynthesis protein 2